MGFGTWDSCQAQLRFRAQAMTALSGVGPTPARTSPGTTSALNPPHLFPDRRPRAEEPF